MSKLPGVWELKMRLSGDYSQVQGLGNIFRDRCFQYGDCGLEVYRITKKAMARGIRNFLVIEGMVHLNGDRQHPLPHTWIEMDGQVKDPTASQFGSGDIEYSTHHHGEYREEYTPQQYVRYFEDQYGDLIEDL